MNPTPNEAEFVRDGKAEIRIFLTGTSKETSERLKSAGFEISAGTGDLSLVGRIAIGQLARLATLDEVKLILQKI